MNKWVIALIVGIVAVILIIVAVAFKFIGGNNTENVDQGLSDSQLAEELNPYIEDPSKDDIKTRSQAYI